MHVWDVLYAAHREYRKQKFAKKLSHLRNIAQVCRAISSQLSQISTIGKKLPSNSNIFSTRSHTMVNFGPLTAEICWRVWGTPANFNAFRVLASLLYQLCLTEVNQTLQDVWPSHVLIHYMYIFWGSMPLTEFCHVQNSLYVQVLRSPV